jgi:hypothetical protein
VLEFNPLDDLGSSDQALQRVLSNARVAHSDHAEALSLIARNIKERWRRSWNELSGERAVGAALQSP